MRKQLLATAIAFASCAASAQDWEVMTYYLGQPWQKGLLRLTETAPGQHKVKLVVPNLDECHRREWTAQVERGPTELIIYAKPMLAGCNETRWVIRTDNSGGRWEYKQGDGSWFSTPNRDYILKRKE